MSIDSALALKREHSKILVMKINKSQSGKVDNALPSKVRFGTSLSGKFSVAGAKVIVRWVLKSRSRSSIGSGENVANFARSASDREWETMTQQIVGGSLQGRRGTCDKRHG